jgi:arginyl-tRNA synthetase
MNIFKYYTDIVKVILNNLVKSKDLPEGLNFDRISVEPPRDASHGDVAINAAMVLAKPAGLKPRDLAAKIVIDLEHQDSVEGVEIAGPGFINLSISNSFWQARIAEVLALGENYGSSNLGNGEKVNVEYVSANPTGPLHVGHVRGAVFGDALANLLAKAGFEVGKEYYVNDAGSQIDTLARSVYLRYREALGQDIGKIPEGYYPGDYLIPVGKKLAAEYGEELLSQDEAKRHAFLKQYASDEMIELIKDDLKSLGIVHAEFVSEQALHNANSIEKAINYLDGKGLIYEGVLEPPKGKLPDDWEARPQTLFKATDFGDDVDRALKKSDGSYTYFAADISYHFNKLERGFKQQVDVLGADHGGYVKRLKAAVKAMSGGEASLDVRLCQMVRLSKNGEPVKMSKRSGSFVTLRDLLDEVGRDVVRFIMLTRKNDAPLDFDFAKVTEQSKDNPVFYVQYANARVHSVLQKAKAQFEDADYSDQSLAKADMTLLNDDGEINLIKAICQWPRVVEQSALSHEPHRIAFYLYDLASEFHSLWNKGNDDNSLRFIIEGEADLTKARMAMITALARVVASGLKILGVEPLQEMH